MRLLNTSSCTLESFLGAHAPPYAILSHTWQEEEVTFDDITDKNGEYRHKKGYNKILATCDLALRNGLNYAWIDTCCIDKSSSNELTEAINSMFRWYTEANICYVYLSDVSSSDSLPLKERIASCRWFTRGWTLQELLAPQNVEFYNQYGDFVGTKHLLAEILADITGIDIEILQDKSRPPLLYSLPVARRMSFAARRETTRVEDIAYCLLGIFNVSLSLIYGEGEKAFFRLQEEIIRQFNDLSIFAWVSDNEGLCGMLANSPAEFQHSSRISNVRGITENPEFSITNKGIKIYVGLFSDKWQTKYDENGHEDGDCILPLGCSISGNSTSTFLGPRLIGVWINVCGPGMYVRTRPNELWMGLSQEVGAATERYILKQIPPGSDLKNARRRMRHNCFYFNFPFTTTNYRYEGTYPATWWNQDERVYYRSVDAEFYALHTFRTWVDDTEEHFALFFGVATTGVNQNDAWVSFMNRRADPHLFDDAMAGNLSSYGALGRLSQFTIIYQSEFFQNPDPTSTEAIKSTEEVELNFGDYWVALCQKEQHGEVSFHVNMRLRSRFTSD